MQTRFNSNLRVDLVCVYLYSHYSLMHRTAPGYCNCNSAECIPVSVDVRFDSKHITVNPNHVWISFTHPIMPESATGSRRNPKLATLGVDDTLGTGDSSPVLDVLPQDLADVAFDHMHKKVG